VTTGKLVTDLRDSNGSHFDFGEPLIFFVGCDDDLIDDATFCVLERSGAVLELPEVGLTALSQGLFIGFEDLADDNIISTNLKTWLDKAVKVELVIGARLPPRGLPRLEVRDAKDFVALLRVIIGTEEDRTEETSIDGTLIQHDRVLLVVTCVASDSDD
jgi:hypothetical protein